MVKSGIVRQLPVTVAGYGHGKLVLAVGVVESKRPPVEASCELEAGVGSAVVTGYRSTEDKAAARGGVTEPRRRRSCVFNGIGV